MLHHKLLPQLLTSITTSITTYAELNYYLRVSEYEFYSEVLVLLGPCVRIPNKIPIKIQINMYFSYIFMPQRDIKC